VTARPDRTSAGGAVAAGDPVAADLGPLTRAATLRVGLISDSHIPEARARLWDQVFTVFDGVDCILHGGDIHVIEVIDQLSRIAPTFVARGNGDDGSGGRPRVADDDRLQESWLLDLGGVRVGITHDLPIPEYPPGLTVASAKTRIFGTSAIDVLVYGHSHVESIDVLDGSLCVNPGSPTYPHNRQTQLGTVGFLDIRDGRATASLWQLTESGAEPMA
jgi:uncharacterized protein